MFITIQLHVSIYALVGRILVVLIDIRKICMKCTYVAGKFVNWKLFKIPVIKTLLA